MAGCAQDLLARPESYRTPPSLTTALKQPIKEQAEGNTGKIIRQLSQTDLLQ